MVEQDGEQAVLTSAAQQADRSDTSLRWTLLWRPLPGRLLYTRESKRGTRLIIDTEQTVGREQTAASSATVQVGPLWPRPTVSHLFSDALSSRTNSCLWTLSIIPDLAAVHGSFAVMRRRGTIQPIQGTAHQLTVRRLPIKVITPIRHPLTRSKGSRQGLSTWSIDDREQYGR